MSYAFDFITKYACTWVIRDMYNIRIESSIVITAHTTTTLSSSHTKSQIPIKKTSKAKK